jgi:hypothetical protein
MCDLDFTKYTNSSEKIKTMEPNAMVMFSWAAEGLRNIFSLMSPQVDSVQLLYWPDDQS